MCSHVNWNYLLKLGLVLVGVVFFCEFFIYYVMLLRCSWPQLNEALKDPKVLLPDTYKPVKAMILSDTHLLGSKRGHWFDKLRREWQMHRSFQSVMTIHSPDVVFFLGDLFDEGLWADTQEFRQYITRFDDLFQTPEKTQVYTAVGNHDVGFHYAMTTHLHDRFVNAFHAPAVNLIEIEGNAFVIINSMAMEGDRCSICGSAEHELKRLGRKFRCQEGEKNKCTPIPNLPPNTRPVLLQHMPLYRQSEEVCAGPDSPPPWEKSVPNREKWECLSKESTNKLFKWLNPRIILDGHTHHGCYVLHGDQVPEWTVASFSWRNRNNPSFLLATFTPNNFAVTKCYLPEESTVIFIYIISGIALLLWIILTRRRFFRNNIYAKVS